MFTRRRLPLILSLLVSLAFPGLLNAQIAGGLDESNRTDLGGRHFLTGRVLAPDGQPISHRIRIRLSSTAGKEIITTTDDAGKFIFTGLSNASYTISVDEDKDYEAASQQVDIFETTGAAPKGEPRGYTPSQYFNVSLRLVSKVKTGPTPKVIHTENAQVPRKALAYYDAAMKLVDKGDRAGVIEQLKQAVAAYPAFMLAYTELGVQYLSLNDLGNAETSLAAALKLKPEAYEPNVNMGILLVRGKRFSEAEAPLRAALKANENSAVAQFYLGRTLIALRRTSEAESALKAAVTLSGDTLKEAHRVLASLYLDTGDYPKAAAEIETYLQANPPAADAENLRSVLKQIKDQPAGQPQKP
jgi:type IV pilus assembly protein PilF